MTEPSNDAAFPSVDDLTLDYGRSLNRTLVLKQKLGPAQLQELRREHARMDALKRFSIDSRHDPAAAKASAASIQESEFTMQALWGFAADASLHTHWLQIPYCTCSRGANEALYGKGVRVVDTNCPFHAEWVPPNGPEIQVVRVDMRDDRLVRDRNASNH